MIRDITVGQYYPSESVVHKLDPRTKIYATFVFIISIFLLARIWWYGICLLLVLIMFATAKVPFSYLMKGLRGIILLLVFTVFFRMTITPGEIFYSWSWLEFTKEGLAVGMRLALRISLMISGASLLLYTTTAKEVADGLEKMFKPLEKYKIPIHDMAVIIMIAFRFIPILIEEVNILMDAMMARGVDFKNGSIIQKMKNITRLMWPLFYSVLLKTTDIANAMESRGYTGQQTTSNMYPLVYGQSDKWAMAIIIVFMVVNVVVYVGL